MPINAKLGAQIKRGDKSWAYFPIAYNILLTLTVGIIAILPIDWSWRLMIMLVSAYILFKLCFSNSKFMNKIVGIMSRSQETIENL